MNNQIPTTSVFIDRVTVVADQNNHVERLVHGFLKFLVRFRGPLAATKWKREIDKFMRSNTYDAIITKLEGDFNSALLLTYNELQQIINP